MKGIKEINTGNNGVGLEFTSKSTKGLLEYNDGKFKVDGSLIVNETDITPGEIELLISSGTRVKPTIVYNTGLGTVTVGNGTYRFYKEADYSGPIVEEDILESTLSVNDDVTSYVIAEYNNGTPIYSVTENISAVIDATSAVIYTVYRKGDSVSIIDWDEPGVGLPNKLHRRLIETERFSRVYGLELGEFGTRNISVASGKVWEGSFPNVLQEVDSTLDEVYLVINNGDGTYGYSTVTQYPNTQYDNKSGVLQTLTDGNYGVIWVYRSMDHDSKRIYIILGNGDYTLNEAVETQPVEIHPSMSTNGLLLGRIIVLKSAATATKVDSAFDTKFSPSVSTNHQGLTGLTGGHNGVYDHLPVYNSDGTTEILSVDTVNNRVIIKDIDSPISNYLGNGVISGFNITINTDTSKIDIASGIGNSINNADPLNPVWTTVNFAGATALTLTNLATANATYIAIDSTGAVVQQTTPFAPTQRGSGLIIIGAAIHSNKTNVNVINNLPDVIVDNIGQFNELLDSVGNFNVEGNVFSANGANFNINKSSGTIFKRGCNFETDPRNPHIKTMPALIAPSNIRYRLQDGTEYVDTSIVDHLYYDNAGVKTAVPNHKFTVQRITLFSSDLVRIQYGQHVYSSVAEAIQGISIDPFVVESNIKENGLLRALLIVGEDAIDLSDAVFLKVDKFGGTEISGAGSAVTTLQQAYNNSVTPEILTDTTRGAVTIKRGSAADTDNISEGQNGAGTVTSYITGNGDIVGRSFGSELMKVSDGLFETAVANTEYYSPEQHGGVYGTVYRTYFTTTIPSHIASGNNVSKLVESFLEVHDGANRLLAGGHAEYTGTYASLYLSGTSGNGNIFYQSSVLTLISGWVDYTK